MRFYDRHCRQHPDRAWLSSLHEVASCPRPVLVPDLAGFVALKGVLILLHVVFDKAKAVGWFGERR